MGDEASRPGLDTGPIPFHRRFHVRTTTLFAVPILVLLAALAVSSRQLAVDAEHTILTTRLRALAVALAEGISEDELRALSGSNGEEARARMARSFAQVAAGEPEVASVYIVEPTDREGFVRFAIDWVRTGRPAAAGELYDARSTDRLLAAREGPTVESRIYADAWGPSLSGYAPIRGADGASLAVLGVDVAATRIEAMEMDALVAVVSLYGVGFLLFVLGGLWLGRIIRAPIAALMETTARIARGELSARTGLSRGDELGLLAGHVDRMARELGERDRMRAIFGRYVSEEVASRALEGKSLEAEGREVTILFTDIRRYSTLSEHLAPEEVVLLLNDYFSAMIEVIDAHDGVVVELLGDAILAVFGAPNPSEDHPERAFEAALRMREALGRLRARWAETGIAERWRELGVERFGARIGVHTGRVVAGVLGGDRRARYTVLGPAVNVAMRLEAANEALGSEILISAATFARLPESLAARCEDPEEHAPESGVTLRVHRA